MTFGILDQAFVMNVTCSYVAGMRLDAYGAARRRATLTRLIRTIQRKRHSLLPLPGTARLERATYVGVKQVPITAITGSVNRSRDFDADFLPLGPVDEARWLRVYSAVAQGVELPPVQLIKVDEHFFVLDGHHRVSVARLAGMEHIEAEVREYVFAPVGQPARVGEGEQVTRGVSEPLSQRSRNGRKNAPGEISGGVLPSFSVRPLPIAHNIKGTIRL